LVLVQFILLTQQAHREARDGRCEPISRLEPKPDTLSPWLSHKKKKKKRLNGTAPQTRNAGS